VGEKSEIGLIKKTKIKEVGRSIQRLDEGQVKREPYVLLIYVRSICNK
jgi:hypothetical protein